MHLSDLWFIAIAVLWAGYFVLEGFDFGVGILLPVLGRDQGRRRIMINTIGPSLGRQRGLAAHRGRRHLRGVPRLVRVHVQRLLPATAAHPGRADHPRRRVRVPRQAGERGLAAQLGHGDLRRLAAARDLVGRGLRQRAARHPAERGAQLRRQLLHHAEPVLTAGRAGHADPVHLGWCPVPGPEDHGGPAPGGDNGGPAVRAGGGRRGRRFPRLDRVQLPGGRARRHWRRLRDLGRRSGGRAAGRPGGRGPAARGPGVRRRRGRHRGGHRRAVHRPLPERAAVHDQRRVHPDHRQRVLDGEDAGGNDRRRLHLPALRAGLPGAGPTGYSASALAPLRSLRTARPQAQRPTAVGR